MQCCLCRRDLSFQRSLICCVFCLKRRLSSIQRIIQRLDLIVQRLVAVCNGFVELCFGIVEVLLDPIYRGLQCGLCRRDLSFQRGLIGYVFRLKRHLSSIQSIIQRFDLIVQ